MLRGLIGLNGSGSATLDAVEYRIDLTATLNETSLLQSAQASLVQPWTPDQDTTDAGFAMTAQRIVTSPGTVTKRYTLDFPLLSYASGNVDKADGSSLAVRLLFEDIVLLQERDNTWKLKIGAVTWTLDGSTEQSWGSQTFYGALLTPSGVPVFGIVPWIAASAGAGRTLTLPPSPDENPYDVSSYASAVIGFRHKYPGDAGWTAHPVFYDLPTDQDSGVCGLCKAYPSADLSGTDTWTVSAAAMARLRNTVADLGIVDLSCDPPCTTNQTRQYHLYDSSIEQRTVAVSGHVAPDLSRGVVRLNTDYCTMVYRGGMPRQTQSATWTCGDCSEEGRTFGATGTKLPSQTDILFVAGDPAHSAEDTFTKRPAGLFSISETVTVCQGIAAVLVRAGLCSKPIGYEGDCEFASGWDETVDVCCRTWDADNESVQRRDGTGGNAKMLGYLAVPSSGAGDPLYGYAARYTNYWLSPHWSYVVWFPPDGVYGSAYAWPLRAADTDPGAYWLPLKSQWLYHALLPTNELRRTRADVVDSPLAQSGMDSFFSTSVLGQVTSFWGSRGFVSVDVDAEAPASLQLDETSEPGWTVTDATPTFTADGIELIGL